MNKQLHPELVDATIVCACGAEYKTRSVRDTINVEVCSNCHPFYTGKQRRVTRGGRVERFNKKYGLSEEE
ncbi:MAG: 50S ribosomal protein L31 [Halanaerobiales bacterium]